MIDYLGKASAELFLFPKIFPLQVGWACSMGSKPCLDKAQESFRNWMEMEEPDLEEANL